MSRVVKLCNDSVVAAGEQLVRKGEEEVNTICTTQRSTVYVYELEESEETGTAVAMTACIYVCVLIYQLWSVLYKCIQYRFMHMLVSVWPNLLVSLFVFIVIDVLHISPVYLDLTVRLTVCTTAHIILFMFHLYWSIRQHWFGSPWTWVIIR